MNLFRNLPFYAAADDSGGGDKGDPKPDAVAAAAAGGDKGDQGDKGDKGGSFLAGADDDAGDATKKIVAPADFPEDWRDKMAGADKELRKALDRYDSPAAVAKANRDAQVKLRSGKALADEPMPDGEKDPDALKAWREARGVPPDPTGYTVPDSVKNLVTDEDKPRLGAFTELMHSKGVPAAAVGPVLEWYFNEQASIAAAEAESDNANKAKVEDDLRSEWGADFRANSTVAKRFAEEITPGLNWFDARLPDGRKLGDVPDFVKALSKLGHQEFGDVAFAGGDNIQKTLDRETELRNMMRDDYEKYSANPAYSAELTKINEAKQKRAGARGGQGGDGAKPF